jgi:thioredoxin-like negative regulator of GroEL
VPTLLVFKAGQVREQMMGFLPKEKIVEKIDVVL